MLTISPDKKTIRLPRIPVSMKCPMGDECNMCLKIAHMHPKNSEH